MIRYGVNSEFLRGLARNKSIFHISAQKNLKLSSIKANATCCGGVGKSVVALCDRFFFS